MHATRTKRILRPPAQSLPLFFSCQIVVALHRIFTMKKTARCCPPESVCSPGKRTISTDSTTELADLAKALGHPARMQIVQLLLKRNACVCGEIVDELPLAQSTVSQHLKVLKDAGLIYGNIDGPSICYCINPDAITRLKSLVATL